jgi:hypothetical protein
MLLTAIDKAKNSICKNLCGYILGRVNIFNPVNWALVQCANVFPVDYAPFTLIVLLFFCSSVVGIAAVGIRCAGQSIPNPTVAHAPPGFTFSDRDVDVDYLGVELSYFDVACSAVRNIRPSNLL